MSDLLTVEEDRGVLVATLNRPNKGNALNQPLIDAIDDFCAEVEARAAAGEPRTVVVTGAGEKAFCAGADVTELDGISADHARAQMLRGQQVFDRLERLPVAVIGAINGFALGGGLELAMSTDFRVAHPSARVGQPEISLGNVPGWGGTQRLPALVGRGLAMILTGDLITAQRAYEIGLVNGVNDDPLGWATDMAQRIAENNPVAVSGAKVAIRTGLEAGIAQGLIVEADAVAACCDTDFQKAAVRAFLDRRSRRS